MRGIRFGTDGWRDVIADNYTFKNVRRVAQAYADYLKDEGADQVAAGFDTRFLSDRFARTAAEVLAANGLLARLAKRVTPTPVTSFAVKYFGADGGVMITASHNPPEYNGFKLKGAYGGSATPKIVAEVEARLDKNPPAAFDPDKHVLEPFDVRTPYYEHLMGLLDMEALKAYEGVLYHDAMGGAGGGWISGFAKKAKLKTEVRELHAVPHPLFYGVNPEPIPKNLTTLMAVMRNEADPTFAAVTDGDADRIGVVLAGGRYFNSHQIFAVLLKHLVRKGRKGRVIKTFSVSKVIDLLAEKLGLEVLTTPVGFKYITDEFLKGDVLIGGEESGGIGVAGHLPERDGILNALLLLESVAVTGKSLAEQFAEIEHEIGFKHAFDRLDLRLLDNAAKDAAMARAKDPVPLAGRQVTSVETLDGVKWHLGEDAWVLFRPSGTEPVLRIYAEGPTPEEVARILAEAKKAIGL